MDVVERPPERLILMGEREREQREREQRERRIEKIWISLGRLRVQGRHEE
jgi:hypothetical protein